MRDQDSLRLKKFYVTRKRRLFRFVLYDVVILMKKKSLAASAFLSRYLEQRQKVF